MGKRHKGVVTTPSSSPTPANFRLFAYGTLNVHDIQRELWGEAKEGEPVVLNNYELKRWPSSPIFYIEKKIAERVIGKVYTITREQLDKTDIFETDAYKRVWINTTATTPGFYVYVRDEESGKEIGGLA